MFSKDTRMPRPFIWYKFLSEFWMRVCGMVGKKSLARWTTATEKFHSVENFYIEAQPHILPFPLKNPAKIQQK